MPCLPRHAYYVTTNLRVSIWRFDLVTLYGAHVTEFIGAGFLLENTAVPEKITWAPYGAIYPSDTTLDWTGRQLMVFDSSYATHKKNVGFRMNDSIENNSIRLSATRYGFRFLSELFQFWKKFRMGSSELLSNHRRCNIIDNWLTKTEFLFASQFFHCFL